LFGEIFVGLHQRCDQRRSDGACAGSGNPLDLVASFIEYENCPHQGDSLDPTTLERKVASERSVRRPGCSGILKICDQALNSLLKLLLTLRRSPVTSRTTGIEDEAAIPLRI
jgi:hypothetical protein